ncbi:hypothetical protein [Paracoccus sp. (in: a-proteobacteria)]|uniref:hypothetical protein n=1 Tax=Paracoccus sp. TaxID=267 RepID=UPI00396C376A
MTHAPALTVILLLAACGAAPDYPALLPTAQVLAEPAVPTHAVTATNTDAPVVAAEEGRAAALRARAEALRGPVVEPDLRRRAGG